MNLKEMNYKEMAGLIEQIRRELENLKGAEEIREYLSSASEDLKVLIEEHQKTARGEQ